MTLKNKTTIVVTALLTTIVLFSSISTGLVSGQLSAAQISQYSIPTDDNTIYNVAEDEIPQAMLNSIPAKAISNAEPLYTEPLTIPQRFLGLETQIHGFSGVYVDESGKLVVYTSDSTVKSVDQKTIANMIGPDYLSHGVIIKSSKHSYHKWAQLELILLKLFDDRNLGVTSMGLDDKNQVYTIGFEKLDDSRKIFVDNFLAKHKIPSEMIKLVETGKLVPTKGDDSTQDYAPVVVNPIAAGSEIGLIESVPAFGSYTPHCTLGLIATTGGQYVGVTAGHCQDFNGGKWFNGKQQYVQPYSTSPYNVQHVYPLGRSVATAIAHAVPSVSDAVLTSITETQNFGKIYTYNGVSTTYKTISGKLVSVSGSQICYMGATSGIEKCGTVSATNQSIYDSGLSKTISGQVTTNISPAKGGDSGSPVYSAFGSNIPFAGTVWCCDGGNVYYSPIQGIDQDYGTLTIR
jgi:hypothetical protein